MFSTPKRWCSSRIRRASLSPTLRYAAVPGSRASRFARSHGGTDGTNDLASAEIYDPKTGTFAATGSMKNARVYQTATLLSDGRVLVAGGGADYTNGIFLASAELYDPKTGTFSVTGSMIKARTYQTASVLADGRVLVTGGYGAQAPLASAELYDPKTGTFSPAGSGG
jgi:hypothetical protein